MQAQILVNPFILFYFWIASCAFLDKALALALVMQWNMDLGVGKDKNSEKREVREIGYKVDQPQVAFNVQVVRK